MFEFEFLGAYQCYNSAQISVRVHKCIFFLFQGLKTVFLNSPEVCFYIERGNNKTRVELN